MMGIAMADVRLNSQPSLTADHLPNWWDGVSLYGWCSRLYALRRGKARTLGRLLIINLSAVPPWIQSLGSAVILALWLGVLWIINRLFWAPWRWLRSLRSDVRPTLIGR